MSTQRPPPRYVRRVLVRDLMHAGLITCRAHAPIAEVAATLRTHAVHALVVTGEDGTPLGFVSDTDLLAGEWLALDRERLEALRELTAGTLVSAPPVTIDAAASAGEAAALLHGRHLGRLLVLDESVPVGVIAVSDLVRTVAASPAARRAVRDVMLEAVLVVRPETDARAVARAMSERHTRAVVVVDARGTAVGVVTGQDILRLYDRSATAAAADLMRPPLTIAPDAPLHEAAAALLQHEVHRLVVDDPRGGFPLGTISTSDIIAEMAALTSEWLPSREAESA